MTQKDHEHELVFIKEFSGDHKIYWCRECGMITEVFSMMTACMVPTWSKSRLLKIDHELNKYKFVKERNVNNESRRLGRGLKDISKPSQNNLDKLFKTK